VIQKAQGQAELPYSDSDMWSVWKVTSDPLYGWVIRMLLFECFAT